MITVTFAGHTVSAYQDSEINYTVDKKETVLVSGYTHVALSTITSSFPREFDCYTEDYSEITTLIGDIGTFGTLVISSTSYTNCYISSLGAIKEIIRGSGKYTYSIKFGRAGVY